MGYRSREEQIVDELITAGVAIKGGNNVIYFDRKVESSGKTNHKLQGNFFVKSPLGKDIKFYVFTYSQFNKWISENANQHPSFVQQILKIDPSHPKEYLYYSKKTSEGKFEVNIQDTSVIYFVIDNSRSFFTSKEVQINVLEKWDEDEFSAFTKRKIVTAKEELKKAQESCGKDPEEVFGHLRTSIELSIKEKFGFQKVTRMKDFLSDARKFNFPIPSYDLIYAIYSEGNKRLHSGEINTEFDTEESIRMVKNFIEKLSAMDISEKQIKDFKKQSNSVK